MYIHNLLFNCTCAKVLQTFPFDVVCCKVCWKLSSLGGRIGTFLLSKPQPLCVSVYLSLCQCASGEIEALC